MECACAVLYYRLCLVCLYHIFSHYIIKGTIFGKKNSNKMGVPNFSKMLTEIFLFYEK